MDEKRLEIMERASAVYMKHGIKAITMDDLARELNISKKTIYENFANKDELIFSIIQLKTEMDSALCMNCLQQSENAIESLICISRVVATHIGGVNSTVFYDLRKYHRDSWDVLNQHKQNFVLDMIKENIIKGMKEGLYRSDTDVEIAARFYVGAIELLLSEITFPSTHFSFDHVFEELIRYHVSGIASSNGLSYISDKLLIKE